MDTLITTIIFLFVVSYTTIGYAVYILTYEILGFKHKFWGKALLVLLWPGGVLFAIATYIHDASLIEGD